MRKLNVEVNPNTYPFFCGLEIRVVRRQGKPQPTLRDESPFPLGPRRWSCVIFLYTPLKQGAYYPLGTEGGRVAAGNAGGGVGGHEVPEGIKGQLPAGCGFCPLV